MALRWRHLWHLLWGLPGVLGLLIALAAASPFVFLRNRAVRDWALDRARVGALFGSATRVRVDRVERLDPGGADLVGLRVESRTDRGWVGWAGAGRLEVRVRPGDLLSRRIYVPSLVIDSVWLAPALAPAASRAPKARGEPARPPRPRIPAIRCGTFAVRRITLEDGDGRRWSGELEVSGLDHREGQVRGTLRRAFAATVPETLFLAFEDGLVEGELIDRFRLSSVKVTAPGLQGRLDGAWLSPAVSSDSAGHVQGEVQITSLAPAALSVLRSRRLPLEAGDRIAGRLRAHLTLPRGAPPRAELEMDLAGTLFGTPLETLAVAVNAAPDRAELEGMRLRFGGMAVQGNARVSRPGAARAAVRVARVDLSAPPISRFAPELPASDLSGELRATVDSIGPRIRLEAALDLDPGTILGRPLSGLSIQARLEPGLFTLDELRTREDDGETEPRLRLRGTFERATGRLRAEGWAHRLPLEDWVAPWLGGTPLEGRVTGPVRLGGTLRRPEVEGDLGGRAIRVEEVYLDTLHLGGVRGSLSPLRLRGDFSASGLDIYKIGLDSLRGPVTVSDTITTRLTAKRDTTEILLGLRVLPITRGAVLFDSLAVRAGSAPELRLDGTSRLNWSPELVRIDSIRVRSDAGVAWGRGRIEPRPGRSGTEPFRFEVHAESVDCPAVAAYFGLPAENLAGRGSADFSGEGTVRSPVYRFAFAADGMETYEWFWDRIRLAGSAGEGVGIRLDSLRVIGSGYLGSLPGLDPVGPMLPGPPLVVKGDSLALRLPSSWEEAFAALTDPSKAEAALAGASLEGRLEARGVPVAPLLAPLLQARGANGPTAALGAESRDPMLARIEVVRPRTSEEDRRRPSGIGGTLDCDLRLGGTGNDLALDLDLVGRGVWVYQAWADSVRVRASAGRRRALLHELRWQMGETELRARGDVGLRLSAGSRPIRPADEPGWLEADLEQADLALFSLVTGVIQDPVGRLSGHVRAEGPLDRMRLSGNVTVMEGAFRVPGREERFSRIDAAGTIDSLGMHVEATGRLNQEGRVRASGLVRSLDDFDLTAKVEDAPVFETGNYRFLAEAEVRARPVSEGDSLRPRVTGKARVLEGLITKDLSKPPGRLPPRTPWLVELEVEAPGNFRLNQPFAVVDLGEGNLRVSFRWPYWNLAGSMEVLGGSYRLFNRNLRITSGTVTFTDTGQGPDPLLDIHAETKIPGTVEQEDIQVELHVVGYPARKELTVTLTGRDAAGTEYTEAQLIERMSVGQIQSSQFGTFSSTDPTRQALSSELVGQIERQLVGQLPWIDRIQLEGQIGGQDPMRINVRPIVLPQWSVVYSQELSASPDREVSVRYRLSNLLFLNAAVDRRQLEGGVPLDTYSLDLKLRFDY